MKNLAFLLCAMVMTATVHADLQMPKKENFYDRLGHGIANIVLAPSHLLDSPYELMQVEGPTVGATKGVVQGTSRMVMDFFVGIAEVVTSPFPVESLKQPAYDSHVVEAYPPADLYDNWY
ncbi:MAG: exosortase system-associated protein, TIGR04073 family [Verrucomicrobiota bacterium]